MKSTIIRAAAVVAAFTAISAAPVAAQGLSPISFNVRAGAAMPLSDLGDAVSTGFNVGAGLSFRPAMLPVGLRFDGDYNRFAGKDLLDGTNLGIWALTANAVLAPAMSPIYAIGGLGYYSQNISGEGIDSDSESDMGFNIGGGFKLPLTGFSTFVEARYHHVMTKDDDIPGSVNTKFLPIVFGIQF
jgi:hypothetical protein